MKHHCKTRVVTSGSLHHVMKISKAWYLAVRISAKGGNVITNTDRFKSIK